MVLSLRSKWGPTGQGTGAAAHSRFTNALELLDLQHESRNVCIFSVRSILPQVFRCADFEFEDVVKHLENADLILPEWRHDPLEHSHLWQRIQNKGGFDFSLRKRIKPIRLEKDYDLFFCVLTDYRDLVWLRAITNLRQRCRKIICWINEIWTWEVLQYPKITRLFDEVDLVLLPFSQTVPVLSERIAAKCVHLAPSADATLFCPDLDMQPRSIDVMNMGRRSEVTHAVLLDYARKTGMNYLFDTLVCTAAIDPAAHRFALANNIRRSRFFITNVAKVNCPSEHKGQQEVGHRFFEGAAAGAVMIGTIPNVPAFSENFPYLDAAFPMPFDNQDVVRFLKDLDQQPERLRAVRQKSVANHLRRNDWSHRWRAILAELGLAPSPEHLNRELRLNSWADRIEQENPFPEERRLPRNFSSIPFLTGASNLTAQCALLMPFPIHAIHSIF